MREENRQIGNESAFGTSRRSSHSRKPKAFYKTIILYLGIRLLDLPQQLAKREHAARRGRQVQTLFAE